MERRLKRAPLGMQHSGVSDEYDLNSFLHPAHAFEPSDIAAMSMALDDVCKALKLDGDAKAKEIVAVRIIELARRGERNPARLRDRLLNEANGGTRC